MLTQAHLMTLLMYNPNTGDFTRKIARPKQPIGEVAGCLKSKGYISIKIDGKDYKAHRLAWLYMTGEWPPNQLDHKDDNKANNKWENLQLSNPSHNNIKKVKKLGISGYTGVHRKRSKWYAYFARDNKIHYVGCFNTPEEARSARALALQTRGDI